MNYHIKYRQLRAFALVAQFMSFKAAADQMAVTQSSLSALIRELELDLAVDLFVRTTRTCELTEAGRAFLDEIGGPLDRLEVAYRTAREVGAGNAGRLSLAALPSLCSGILVEKLSEFQKRHPAVRISLAERGHDKVLAAVKRGDVELGFGSMSADDAELDFEPVMTDRLMIVAPLGHPSVDLPAEWESLNGFNLVFMMAGPAERALTAMNSEIKPAFEVEQASTALAMVKHGMGITVLPSSIVPSFNTEGLACRPIAGEIALRRLGIIHRKFSRLSAPAKAFSSLLKITADLGTNATYS